MVPIIPLLYYFLILYGVKYSGYKKYHEDFLGPKITNGLKGYAAVSILIGHLGSRYKKFSKENLKYTPSFPLQIYTSFFLFCSGYGLMINYKKNKNYLNHFLKRRLIVILVPYYLSNIISLSYNRYKYYNNKKSFIENLKLIDLTKNLFIYHFSWFVNEIIILYLLFYLSFKYIKNKNLSMLMILIITWLLFLLPTYNNNFLVRLEYHISIYSFIYGLLIGDYQINIIKFVKTNYYGFFLICLIFPYFCFGDLFKISPYIKGKYFIYFSNFNKINFQSIIIYSCGLIFSMKFQFNNMLLNYFGKYSFEMYLYQFKVFKMFESFAIIDNQFWTIILIFSIVMLISVISNRIGQIIINSVIKRDNEKIKRN